MVTDYVVFPEFPHMEFKATNRESFCRKSDGSEWKKMTREEVNKVIFIEAYFVDESVFAGRDALEFLHREQRQRAAGELPPLQRKQVEEMLQRRRKATRLAHRAKLLKIAENQIAGVGLMNTRNSKRYWLLTGEER